MRAKNFGDRLLAGIAGKNEGFKNKRSSKEYEGNDEVKYCEFVMSKFAALLRMETKTLAQ